MIVGILLELYYFYWKDEGDEAFQTFWNKSYDLQKHAHDTASGTQI